MARTVGQVAKLASVSVRTLHHYDEIGLVRPSEHSDAGYRLYTDADLERLQEVLIYRELDIPLEEIAKALRRPGQVRTAALSKQRALIAGKLARDRALLEMLDKAIAAEQGGVSMSKEEMFEVFGDFDPSQYEEEVQDRWGDTDAYRESARRTKRYKKEDWERIKQEGERCLEAMVALFDDGVAPQDPRALAVAEEARLQIDRNFYPLTREAHVHLGEMYVADARFTEYYDKHRPGLAKWFRDAIVANAAR